VHHIVAATAPFFARRFAQMRWAILTPERSVRWDGKRLAFGPGARREDAPGADAGEQLWLTYYEHIFNPARLKLAMMQKEMPRRYWKNLPEAALIQPLAARRPAQRADGRAGRHRAARRRPAASIALPLDAPQMSTARRMPASLDALKAATMALPRLPHRRVRHPVRPGEGPEGAR
jgi:hypothetical protein